MWKLSTPWWELTLRAVIIYVFLLVILRLTGKRQVGQLAPFDLVLLLVLSNAVQNAMNAGDNSLTAGLLLATALIALNVFVANLSWRSRRIEALLEGKPRVLRGPGEYEIGGALIWGVRTVQRRDDTNGSRPQKNTAFVIQLEELTVCHLGDLSDAPLSPEELSRIKDADVLLVPVGGNCTININSIPTSKITLDGRPIGLTPKVGVSAPAGTHSVMLISDNGRKATTVTCKPGETKTVAMRITQ